MVSVLSVIVYAGVSVGVCITVVVIAKRLIDRMHERENTEDLEAVATQQSTGTIWRNHMTTITPTAQLARRPSVDSTLPVYSPPAEPIVLQRQHHATRQQVPDEMLEQLRPPPPPYVQTDPGNLVAKPEPVRVQ
ncbi:hypothetical protein IW145_001004 [Coemansia sp. RSA 521]|nr:hypothetical protein IW142_000751 [Coemansia sp. RSA 564]KAJ2208086.1 hypothetical protein IW145_001004 [Coemansia sp. RSA 521]KAJ2279138.1 hypothetical protein GGH14_002855 [Coemansia sp. RSA 370]